MAGWIDFLRRLLGWPASSPGAATSRPITVRGSIDTTVSLPGSIDTGIQVVGSETMAVEQRVTFHRGERVAITVTGVNVTGQTVVVTIRDGSTGEILAQSTATVSGGLPTAVFTRAQTLQVPDGGDVGVRQLEHYWDAARTTSGSEAVLAYGKLTCRVSPTLQD